MVVSMYRWAVSWPTTWLRAMASQSASSEELRAALIKFARHYNETWLVARHPSAGRRLDQKIRMQCWPI